jgi:hypothetical protein
MSMTWRFSYLARGELEKYDTDQFFRCKKGHGESSIPQLMEMSAYTRVLCVKLSAELPSFCNPANFSLSIAIVISVETIVVQPVFGVCERPGEDSMALKVVLFSIRSFTAM